MKKTFQFQIATLWVTLLGEIIFPFSSFANSEACCASDRYHGACPGYIDCSGKPVPIPQGCVWPLGEACPKRETDCSAFTACGVPVAEKKPMVAGSDPLPSASPLDPKSTAPSDAVSKQKPKGNKAPPGSKAVEGGVPISLSPTPAPTPLATLPPKIDPSKGAVTEATPVPTIAPLPNPTNANWTTGSNASSASTANSSEAKIEIDPHSNRSFMGSDGTNYGSGTEFTTDPVTGLPVCPEGSMNVPDDLSLCLDYTGVTYSHCAAKPPGMVLLPRLEKLSDETQKAFLDVIDPLSSTRMSTFTSSAIVIGSTASAPASVSSEPSVAPDPSPTVNPLLQIGSDPASAPKAIRSKDQMMSKDANPSPTSSDPSLSGGSLVTWGVPASKSSSSAQSVGYSKTQCAGPYLGSTLYPDTYDAISTQTSLMNSSYGPIFIASDPKTNPWSASTTNKVLACANVNEMLSLRSSSAAGVPFTLAQCVPAITGDHSVLYRNGFDPILHSGEVLPSSFNPGSNHSFLGEPHYLGGGKYSGLVIESTLIQASPTDRSTLVPFNRGIWACEAGFKINSRDGTCAWDSASNGCNAGNGTTIPPSATAPVPPGAPSNTLLAELFNSKINKKLACCSNDFTPNLNNMKLDCLETNPESVTDFDSLWQSVDDDGNLNALYLKNGTGNPISGFYNLNGDRCNEFSEFTNTPIQPGIVNPVMTNSSQMKLANQSKKVNGAAAFESVGVAVAKPSGNSWNETVTRLGNLQPPQSVEDKRRCPLMARAALVVECPKNNSSDPFAVKKTYEEIVGGTTVKRHCASAGNIQIHVKVQQVWQIAGSPPLKPLDTVLSSKDPHSLEPKTVVISMSDIIKKKVLTNCPVGTHYSKTFAQCEY